MENKGKRWALEHEYLLLIGASENLDIRYIAETLGRSPKSCSERLASKILYKSGRHYDKAYEYLLNIDPVIFDYRSKLYFIDRHLGKKKIYHKIKK